MKESIFLFILLLLINSCSYSERNSEALEVIKLSDTLNQTSSNSTLKIESKCIMVDTKQIVSEVKDMVQLNNICYVLDNNKMITCINIKNGNILNQKQQLGHSRQELIMPIALATDSSLLYVYDSGANKVVIFDKNMSYINSKEMPIRFEKFTKVNGGYLCYSEYRPTIHFITDGGKLVYSHSMADYVVDMTFKSNIFARDESKNVYVKAEFSDTIFQWIDGKCIPRFFVDLGKERIPKDIKTTTDIWKKQLSFTMDFFVDRNGLFFSYMNGREKKYVRYLSETKDIIKPSIDMAKKVPFMPQWKAGKDYYAYVSNDILRFIFKEDDIVADKSAILVYKLLE